MTRGARQGSSSLTLPFSFWTVASKILPTAAILQSSILWNYIQKNPTHSTISRSKKGLQVHLSGDIFQEAPRNFLISLHFPYTSPASLMTCMNWKPKIFKLKRISPRKWDRYFHITCTYIMYIYILCIDLKGQQHLYIHIYAWIYAQIYIKGQQYD